MLHSLPNEMKYNVQIRCTACCKHSTLRIKFNSELVAPSSFEFIVFDFLKNSTYRILRSECISATF